jgi:Ca-activated chloride channel family protein
VARAGRGVEVIAGLGDDPERAAQRTVARTDAPAVVDIALEGPALVEHTPHKLLRVRGHR